MAWEENSRICLHMQLIAILSRTGVIMHNNIHIKTIIYIYYYSTAKKKQKRLKTQHTIQYCVFNLIIYI